MSYYDYDDYDDGDYIDPRDDYDPSDFYDLRDDYEEPDDVGDRYDPRDDFDPSDLYDLRDDDEELDDDVENLVAYLNKLKIGSEYCRFGHYRCPKCAKTWTSSNAVCIYKGSGDRKVGKVIVKGEGIFEPNSRQACSNCKPQQMTAPYRTEKLKVPTVDTSGGDKAHRSDLCERCLQGRSCRYTM